MAIRKTTLITKNSNIVNRPLPSNGLLLGEAIVNTADGILYYSGNTTSTSEWTPAGTGATESTYFEVGSNLFDLRLRNRITQYEGESGANLVGKFLSGTTDGFVLADISDIAQSTDSFVTGATWTPNQLTLDLNQGKPSVNVTIDAFSALTITGDLFVEGEHIVNNLTITGTATYDGVANGSDNNELVNWSSLTAHTSTTDKYVTGGTYDNNTALISFSGANGFPVFTVDLSDIDVNDTFITGGTFNYDSNNLNGTLTLTDNDDNDVVITGFTDVRTTGATLINTTVFFDTNEALSAYTLDLSVLDVNDTFVTGFTYDSETNTITLSQNEGQPDLTVSINEVSGLTINGPLTVTGDTTLNGLSLYTETVSGTDGDEIANVAFVTGYTADNDIFVSGGTISYVDNNGTLTLDRANETPVVITGLTDVSVTGFTYDDTTNTFTIFNNDGSSFDTSITSVSGLTIDNLTPGRVVYVGTNGELTDEAGFEYNDVTDLLTVGNIFVNNPSGTTANIGQGGLVIGSGGSSSTPGIGDLVVHGDLTVFGDTTTISTSELYIEDPQITLNYNPTGDTSVTSIGSGILIQDGGGVAGQDAKIGIGQLQGSSISGDTSEYTSTTGFENRGWVTQLNDIVIRNSSPVNFGDPDGVRVLAEGDILDGGTF
jgi:hypothetical protein